MNWFKQYLTRILIVQDRFSKYHPDSVLLNIIFSVLLAFNFFDDVHSYHDDFLSRLYITGQVIPSDVKPFKEDSHTKFSISIPPKDRLEIIRHFMPVCCINAWNANNQVLNRFYEVFINLSIFDTKDEFTVC